MRYSAILTASIVGSAIALTACSAAKTNSSNGQPAGAPAGAPAAAAHSAGCRSKVRGWVHDRGMAQLRQVGADEKSAGKKLLRLAAAQQAGRSVAGPIAQWHAAVTTLETDARAAAGNPLPACANGADYGMAMQKLQTAAMDYLSSISDFKSGSYQAARTALSAGNTATRKAKNALSNVTASIP